MPIMEVIISLLPGAVSVILSHHGPEVQAVQTSTASLIFGEVAIRMHLKTKENSIPHSLTVGGMKVVSSACLAYDLARFTSSTVFTPAV